MGYVREIVESGLSVADRTAGSYVEKARAVAAARAPESTQKLESVVVDLCARAMPLVDQVDTRVDSTLTSAVEIKEAQLQRARDTVQLAQQATEEKLQLAREAKAELQTKIQETRSSTEAKLRDTLEMAKTQAQETKEAKLQKVQATIQMAKSTVCEQYAAKKDLVCEQYAAKKDLVQRATEDASKKYSSGKEAVLTQLQQTKEGVKSQVQAVVEDGSVAKLSLVQNLLERSTGTRYQETTLRLVEAADLVLTKSLAVLPAALPRTLDEMKNCLPERMAYSLNAAQALEEPLRAKLEAAKKRAADLAGRVSTVYGNVYEQASTFYSEKREQASTFYSDKREQASTFYSDKREQASTVYYEMRGELAKKSDSARRASVAAASEAQQRVATAKTQLQNEAQALAVTYSEPTKKALVNVFGKEVVASGYATARPLLPAAVVEWIAEVDGLD